MRTPATVALFGVLVLSGCLQDGGGSSAAEPSSTVVPSESGHHPTTTKAPMAPRPPPSTSSAPTPTPPVQQTPQAAWPPLAEAKIRPGVQTHDVAGNQCTTNFLFRSPDNSTLYLGIAAHCVNGMKIGDPVKVQGATVDAKLAYSSWVAQGIADCIGPGNTMKNDEKCNNDFSLVAIDGKDRSKVHPAVQHFGGPTALMDSTTLTVGARVLGFGNSGSWPAQGEVHWHEGIVSAAQDGFAQFYIQTAAPGIPGDSGSAVLTRAGEAAGLLSTLCYAPCAGQNGVVGLKGQLALAKAHAVDVQLVTWAALDDGMLP